MDLLPLTGADFRSGRGDESPDINSPCEGVPKRTTASNLASRFEQQAKRIPDQIAIRSDHGNLTYQQLHDQAEGLARQLSGLGINSERCVGICMNRTPGLIAAILGVLKSGFAYVPIDPDYPQARIEFMLRDSDARVVVVDEANQSLFDDSHHVIVWNRDGESAAADTAKTVRGISPTSAAYVIYTSGSTGKPKGVTIEHQAAVAMVDWATEVFTMEELRGVLASTSVCFDLSIFEIFVPLCMGGSIVLADNALHLSSLASANDVTLINTVPTAAAELLSTKAIPSSVRTINIAGEPLSKQLVTDLYAYLDQSAQNRFTPAVYNLYGPSEDTTYSTFVRTVANEIGNSTPIGRPIAGTDAFVLDQHLSAVPDGMAGELCLAGDGVARGYWQRPWLTAESFVPNPFSDNGNPMYRTGDRVRYRWDGQLEFLGRVDRQVKLRGFRIELGEIEQALTDQSSIAKAVVVIRNMHIGEDQRKQIVAYLVPVNAAEQLETLSASSEIVQDLRAALGQQLPDYMIPATFVTLPELPLLPNGKIARERLPVPDEAPTENVIIPPKTETELKLLDIWRGLLGRSEIGIRDNFFALGGDSIIVLQAIARAQREGIHFSPRDLFQQPTIESLARVVTRSVESTGVSQEPIVGEVPLTPIQSWFFGLPLTHPHHWNQSLLLDVRRPLSDELLRKSLVKIGHHHDALRARFNQSGSNWQQVYASPTDDIPLRIAREEVQDAESIIHQMADQAQRSFDLSSGPLWRVIYFDLQTPTGPVRRLLVVCHHLIVDGVSWRVLLSDLQLLYRQLERTKEEGSIDVEMLPKTMSVKSWLKKATESLAASDQPEITLPLAGGSDADQRYASVPSAGEGPGTQPSPALRGRLSQGESESDKGQSTLPIDFPHGENTMGLARSIDIEFDKAPTERLISEAPASYLVSVEELLLTALSRTITHWSGLSDFSVQLESHGRDVIPEVDLSRTVGWLTSLYPVTIETSERDDLADSIKSTKQALRDVPGHGAAYGFSRWSISTTNTGDDKIAWPALPPIRFNYLGQTDHLFDSDGLFQPATESTGIARHEDDPRDVAFEINALVSQGRLKIHWIYGSRVHKKETIERLTSDFRDELLRLIDFCTAEENEPALTESDFPLMDFGPGELDDLMRGLG
ncbi:MAG: amino acid adenylation domain-containing protein [Planctomycetota bacterium]